MANMIPKIHIAVIRDLVKWKWFVKGNMTSLCFCLFLSFSVCLSLTGLEFAKCAFRCWAPYVWNSLTSFITSGSLTTFKSRRLKTYFFRLAFDCSVHVWSRPVSTKLIFSACQVTCGIAGHFDWFCYMLAVVLPSTSAVWPWKTKINWTRTDHHTFFWYTCTHNTLLSGDTY